MTPPPQLPSRKTLIDFSAEVARRHRVPGHVVRRLMRLCARYRTGEDSGDALQSLHDEIVNTLPRAEFIFATTEVYVDGVLVP